MAGTLYLDLSTIHLEPTSCKNETYGLIVIVKATLQFGLKGVECFTLFFNS